MAKEQILKLYDVNDKRTVFIFFPENIYELIDTSRGCMIRYSQDDKQKVIVADTTARQMKRSIQEQLQEDHTIGFLKLHSNYNNHKGLQYINVKHIAGLIDLGSGCDLKMEYHDRVVGVDENALEVAAQIRRVIKRLDQDQDLCCQPETKASEEAA